MRARDNTGPSRGERGIALVLVLWVLTLMSLMAAGFLTETRTEVRTTHARIEAAEAEALADAGVNWAITRLMAQQTGEPGDGAEAWLPTDGRVVEWTFEDGRVRLSVRDEMGKIDLNVASPEVLRGLFSALGLPRAQAGTLAAHVLDFRDEDDLTRVDGAEDDAYAAAGLSSGAKDAGFQSVQEVGQVLGIGPDLAERLTPHITVESGAPGIAPEAATRAALLAQPELRAAEVDDYIIARGETPPGQPLPPPPTGPDYVRSTLTQYTILAEAHTADGAVFVRAARVTLDRVRAEQPYAVESWSQRMSRLPAAVSPDVAAVRAARQSGDAR